MIKELVISAYDEDYGWVGEINDDVNITIYRKGNNKGTRNEIYLTPNVGRDVHSFFKHICLNYNALSDITFFSQDYPFDHIENYVDIINGDIGGVKNNSIINIGGYYGFHWNSVLVPTPRKGVMWDLQPSNHFGPNNRLLICQSNGIPQDHNPNIDVNRVWSLLFDQEPPNSYEFVPGGHFAITKEQIMIRSLQFYQKIVDLLESDETMPWNIERLECYIFCQDYKSKM